MYFICELKTLLAMRLLCKEWKYCIDELCGSSKCVPDHWDSYMNIYGLSELFPNVETFNNVGHRGHVLSALHKVTKLWLDSPLSTFSIIVCNLSTVNIKHLIIKLDNSFELLNIVASMEWLNLEVLNVISDFQHDEIKAFHWKTSKLHSLRIGSPFCVIPRCICSLPINFCTELCIANFSESICIHLTEWFSNFLDVWRILSIASPITILRLYNVVPECEMCISTLVQVLNVLHVERCDLTPCSSDTCVFLLNNTGVILELEQKRSSIWKNVYIAFGDRIQFKQSVST
tara:strand:- start:702 stop:1565 length:864 start_codon:yes stop_codon:yes gene_type:complete